MSLVTCVIIHPSFPGWKSQPGNGAGGGGGEQRIEDPKCLLSYLKSQSEGGGSKQDFVVPTHRLDQPCTGVLVFAKNGKAASRIQVAWSKKQVKKEYWVVVETGDDLDLLKRRSQPLRRENNGKRSFRLSAILKVNKSSQKEEAAGVEPRMLEVLSSSRLCRVNTILENRTEESATLNGSNCSDFNQLRQAQGTCSP